MNEANKSLMTNVKSSIIVAMIFFIVFLLFISILFANPRLTARLSVFINHGIYLPKPETMTTIYHFTFREGEDLDIWTYSERNFSKVISKRYFHQIDDNNIKDIREKVTDYYKELDGNEKKLFDENMDINKVIREKNYYFYKQSKEDSQTFLIIIADCSSRNLYFLDTVS